MPILGEFIGALLADAVQARVRADLEALKIAETYSNHELLRHMPVPRFRLPDINVDFPVVVDALAGEGEKAQLFTPPPRADLSGVVYDALVSSDIALSAKERRKLYTAVHRRSTELFAEGPQILLSSGSFSRELSNSALEVVKRTLSRRAGLQPPDLAPFDNTLKTNLRTLLGKRLAASPHLQVNVTSSAVKQYGGTDNLVRVRLTISEDAYELVQDDENQLRLIPE